MLAAYLVATSKPHYLRQLDESAFARTAQGCDRFILWTTIPALAIALLLLPTTPGLYVLIAVSVWGILLMLTVERRVAMERRRRASTGRSGHA